jgi:sulfur-carrier protein adenylyltransferase/sulfurtransferase
MNNPLERYERQMLLKGFGEQGQRKLLDAAVLVIGVGGLGCPALQYLAAAGVGSIGIVDDDIVSLTNLHRQVLFTGNDLGLHKVDVAANRLKAVNSDITISGYRMHLTNQNALELFSDYDVIIDGTDNFFSRYVINDACVLLRKPLVYAAISQFEGQVAVFNMEINDLEYSSNYRHLFPEPPVRGSVMNCAEAGVIGVLPGIIGSLQANEAIKLITGIGKPLINQLFTYNSLTNETYVFDINSKESNLKLIPADADAYKEFNYEGFCGTIGEVVDEIDVISFESVLASGGAEVIDVREKGELPNANDFQNSGIPLSQLEQNINKLTADTIVVFCQTGWRSRQAAKLLSTTFGPSKKIFSLTGGILAWKRYKDGKQKT